MHNHSSQHVLRLTSIGSHAIKLLENAERAAIWGVTSRGVFLRLDAGWFIFLSGEPFRGPLTLNLASFPAQWHFVLPGTVLDIQRGWINLSGCRIHIDPILRWCAPLLPDCTSNQFSQRFERLTEVSQGFGRITVSQFTPLPWQGFFSGMQQTNLDRQSLISLLTQNLGLGPGLTPAGDDLVLGFILTTNRWCSRMSPALDIPAITQALVQAAYAQTSTLSANLIECAADGQADERLILAFDGIITGNSTPAVSISSLANWGSSSGAAALQGLALALTLSS